MANSRIMLVCKHCGKDFCIGKGYFGSYSTSNEKLHKQLNIFYGEHEHGCCSEDTDCSDNARNHFAILEEGEDLDVLAADVVPKSEVEELKAIIVDHKANEERWQELYTDTVDKWEKAYEELEIKLENAKAEVVREIFEEIEDCMKCFEDDDDGYLLKKCEFEFFMRELKKKYPEEKE